VEDHQEAPSADGEVGPRDALPRTDMLVLVTDLSSMFAAYEPEREARIPVQAVIRQAAPGDVEACVRIMMTRQAGSAVRRRTQLRQSVQSDTPGFFVAEVDGTVAGFGRVQLLTPPPDAPPNAAPKGWYLVGVVVDSTWRRRGLGDSLTAARLRWVWQRANTAWYFANARNRASIDLHSKYGFIEVARDFTVASVTFDDGHGTGILFRCPKPAGG
jgi:ribosomal protein S18 acetylase RimI-like enzyme